MKVTNYLLGYKNLKIVQDNEMFNFSLDSVLLPNFVTINKKISRILDIGCGNAPIPLILSKKTDAKITGVEIQKEVYELALESISINNKQEQINIVNSQLKLNAENNINYNEIEKYAIQNLGMQKSQAYQIKYINIDKQDIVNNTVTNENKNKLKEVILSIVEFFN